LLARAIPINIPAKIGKSKLCKFMVDVWAVLKPVSTNVKIGRAEMHYLQQYIELMNRMEATVRRAINEANNANKNSKSHKLSSHAMERGYLAECGTYLWTSRL